MASSSYCFVLVSLVLVSQVLFSSASTQYIDAICQNAYDKAFCLKTLNGYPTATSATSTFQAAQAALRLVGSYADKSADFSAKAAVENPSLKKLFQGCHEDFAHISANLLSAASELKESPETANYDVMVSDDDITNVKGLVGKLSDKASKTVITMTWMMEKLLDIAEGATVAVGG